MVKICIWFSVIGIACQLTMACSTDDAIMDSGHFDPANVATLYDEAIVIKSAACLLEVRCRRENAVCDHVVDKSLRVRERSLTDDQLISCYYSVVTMPCPETWPPIQTLECTPD